MVSHFNADRKWRYRQPLAAINGATASNLSEYSSQSHELNARIKSLKPLNFHSRRRVSATRRTRFSQPMSSAKLVGRGDGGGEASKLCWASNFLKKSVHRAKARWPFFILKPTPLPNGGVRRRKEGTTKPAAEERPLHTFTYFCEVAWWFLRWQRWRSLKCGELSHNDCRQDT